MRRAIIVLLAVLWVAGCTTRPPIKLPGTLSPLIPSDIRVALTTTPGTYRLMFTTPVALHLEEAVYILDASIGELELQLTRYGITIKNERRYLRLPFPITLVFESLDPQPMIRWQGKPYQGTLTLHADDGEVAAVLTVPMDIYVQSVLPAEMPSGKKQYLEALKAQAVAIRTYALWHVHHPRHRWFDVYGDVRDQVLGPYGDDWQNPLIHEAVTATRGMMLTTPQMPRQPVRIQYHSTCGGAFELVGDSLLASRVKKDERLGEENCVISPLHRWVRELSVEQLVNNLMAEKILPRQHGTHLLEKGAQITLSIADRTVSGRSKILTISLPDTVVQVEGFAIRRILQSPNGGALPSNYFFLFPNPQNPRKFYIFGAGYGHGRGLCQWGALGQALEGVGFREILKFYYPNLQVSGVLP